MEDTGAAGLEQSLRKLRTNLRVLHIAAHPDDEDAATLTWLARGQGAHVVLLSLNRGEAGANLISGDSFERLGVLRTIEFLRACQYYGASGLRFTRAVDYGYSKNLAETFRNWDREAVLRDVVRVVREEKPHIILSRFQGSPADGHGNHEAAGILARLAFDAAASPDRFPELGLEPWSAQKLYTSVRRPSDGFTLQVDTGKFDPALGKSYAQMARIGYRQHRSQGAAPAIANAGPAPVYWRLTASRVGDAEREASFMDRLSLPPTIPIEARAMSRALRQWRTQPASAERSIKLKQIARAIQQSLGLEFTALVDPDQPIPAAASMFRGWRSFRFATAGQTFTVTSTLCCTQEARYSIRALAGWQVVETAPGRFRIAVPTDSPVTVAYWSRKSVHDSTYHLSSEEFFGLPIPPEPLQASASFLLDGEEVELTVPVQTTSLDTLGVQYRQSLAIAPSVSLRFATPAGYLPLNAPDYKLEVIARNHSKGATTGHLRLQLPSEWLSIPSSASFDFSREEEELRFEFVVKPPLNLRPGQFQVRAVATVQEREFSRTFEPITLPGHATLSISNESQHMIRALDVKVAPRLKVAYIPGTGDDVPEAMRQLGVSPDIIAPSADLGKYDTILTGIRAYAARPDLSTLNARLLSYVSNGGVLIVQYNTQEYDRNFGPYPYQQTPAAEEVSEEDAPVTILEPLHPVFLAPNRITAADFTGWVEQRGSKFFKSWDPRWTPLIETHDTDQPPQKGVWMVARHGKGLYIYCALAWYRQLPFAVPGAARLFANLISLGAHDAVWRRQLLLFNLSSALPDYNKPIHWHLGKLLHASTRPIDSHLYLLLSAHPKMEPVVVR